MRKLGIKQDGSFVDGIHFVFEGGQVRSMLSLLSFLGAGEYRERYFGIRIPRTNLKADFLKPTQALANGLADNLSNIAPVDPAANFTCH